MSVDAAKGFSVKALVPVLFILALGCRHAPPPVLEPHAAVEQPAVPSEILVLQGVGDLNLAGRAPEILNTKGVDHAFSGTLAILRGAQINFANLESPITDKGNAQEKTFTFRMSPAVVPYLKKAGFNLFSIANNHTLDFGDEGLLQTIELISKEGLAAAGGGKDLAAARQPALIQQGDFRVGLLAYSLTFPDTFYATPTKPGTAFGHEAHIRADIRRLKDKVDLVVVSFHWGAEGMREPKPYQRQLARAAVDEGAQLILGHHPHVPQGVEFDRGVPIFYSMGNYAFGSYSNNVDWGILARTRWTKDPGKPGVRLLQVEVLPLDVNNFRVDFRPVPATGDAWERARTELETMSKPFGTVVVAKKPWMELHPGTPNLVP